MRSLLYLGRALPLRYKKNSLRTSKNLLLLARACNISARVWSSKNLLLLARACNISARVYISRDG